jgi:hypothetical protein
MPVTTPEDEPTLAMDVAPLLQIPPVTALPKVMVRPEQTSVSPVIAAGFRPTVATAVILQPPACV